MILAFIFGLNTRTTINLIERILKIYVYIYKILHIILRHIF